MDKLYEINLQCGDTISSAVEPRIGARRFCIHCDSTKKVTSVSLPSSPAGEVKSEPKSWLAGFSQEAIEAIYDICFKAYRRNLKLESYEYAKYGTLNRIDYSLGTEMFDLLTDAYVTLR